MCFFLQSCQFSWITALFVMCRALPRAPLYLVVIDRTFYFGFFFFCYTCSLFLPSDGFLVYLGCRGRSPAGYSIDFCACIDF